MALRVRCRHALRLAFFRYGHIALMAERLREPPDCSGDLIEFRLGRRNAGGMQQIQALARQRIWKFSGHNRGRLTGWGISIGKITGRVLRRGSGRRGDGKRPIKLIHWHSPDNEIEAWTARVQFGATGIPARGCPNWPAARRWPIGRFGTVSSW